MKKPPPTIKLPGKFGPESRWLIWYIVATLLVLWGWQGIYQQLTIRTIPYSQFKAHLERREVVEAAIKQDEIVGRVIPLAARQTNAVAVPEIRPLPTNRIELAHGMEKAIAETKPFLFRTVRVEDPDLVKELQAAGVE
ncbi:MAG: ATP-dependent metallopeptidase FtsH/Yme1/Tma family protein, partial [Verrucomicrobiia bacterium]